MTVTLLAVISIIIPSAEVLSVPTSKVEGPALLVYVYAQVIWLISSLSRDTIYENENL